MKNALLASFGKRLFSFLIFSIAALLFFSFSASSQGMLSQKISGFRQRGLFKKTYNLFNIVNYSDADVSKTLEHSTILNVNSSREEILQTKPDYLQMNIPADNGRTILKLLLYKVDISANGFNLLTEKGKVTDENERIVHYRGIIGDDDRSVASISISEGEIMGSISNNDGNYVLGKLENNNAGLHIIYNDKDFKQKPMFTCGANTADYANRETPTLASSVINTTTKCVNWYWETDYDIFASKGTVAAVNTYMQGIFNQVATLYANDGMTITLKTLFVWTSQDPYTGPSTMNYLNQFGDYRTSFDGDLANLIGYQGNGGIAWIGGFCSSPRYEMAYSGISSSYNTVPNYSWTVEVLTHEEGHLFGSPHTHDCVWNGNSTRIDSCGDYAGYSSCGGLVPPIRLPQAGGTIMSYCHLTGVGINFSLGFGPQPKSLMINSLNAATCITSCNACIIPNQPTQITGNMSACPNSSQTYTVPAVSGATSYTWGLPSGWTGTSTSNSITTQSTTAGGTIFVNAVNSCGTSASQTATVAISSAPAQPGTIAGAATTCPQSTVTYSVPAVSGASGYAWTLPSGWTGTSITNTISVTAGTAAGTLSVKAYNSCGTSQPKTMSVSTVNAAPTQPGSIAGSATLCSTTAQTYSISDVSGATGYSWILPTGWVGTSTTNSITITPTTGGGVLSVSAFNGCGSSAAQSLTIARASIPGTPGGLTISGGPAQVCPGNSRTYSTAVVSGATYNWTAPAGADIISGQGTNSVVLSFNDNFIASGALSVKAVNGCGTSAPRSITISKNVPPSPGAITASGGTAKVCPGDSRSYRVNAVEGLSYNWTLPAGITINTGDGTDSINVTFDDAFTSSGVLRVAAVNSCGAGNTSSISVSRNVPGTPGAISVTGGVAKVCPGDSRVYSVASFTGLTYNWTLPTGASINTGQGTNTVTISFDETFSAAGTLYVTANNSCGPSAPRSITISRNLPPTPGTITVTGGGAKVCPGDSRTYSLTPTSGLSFNWSAPTGGTITGGQGTNSITMNFDQNFIATSIMGVTATNSCGTSTPRTLNIQQNIPATPGPITGPLGLCINAAAIYSVAPVTSATSYQWILPAGASIIGAQNGNSVSIRWGAVAGAISVKASNSCGLSPARAINVAINCTSGTETGNSGFLNASAYPNPTEGNLILKFRSAEEGFYDISITDISGRTLRNENYKASAGINFRTYDLSSFAQGVYLIRLRSNDKSEMVKIIVE